MLGIQPDITTLGKIIGGGTPVGAYAGPASIMDKIAPMGPVYQAGTLSGNPIAMAAGFAALSHLRTNPQIYNQLEARAKALCDGVLGVAQKAGVAMTVNRVGSMCTFFFCEAGEAGIHDWDAAAMADTASFARFHRGMLGRGVYLPPSQFEAMFVSAAHSEQDVEETVAAARQHFAGA